MGRPDFDDLTNNQCYHNSHAETVGIYSELQDKYIDHLEAERKWINVDVCFPDVGQKVLIYCESQDTQICYRGFAGKGEIWLLGIDSRIVYLNITHWMLLPEGPN